MKKSPAFSSYSNRKLAFTLIEVSIVLVVIGLLVGGVLVGRDLITAAKIRSQIKQFQEFKTAADTFRIKYGYFPGDLPTSDAAQLGFFTFTGSNAGKTYITSSGPPYGGFIYGFGNNNSAIDRGETWVFWQHLSQALLIAGDYGGSVALGSYIQTDTTDPNVGGEVYGTAYSYFSPRSKLSESSSVLEQVLVYSVKYYVNYPQFSGTNLVNGFNFNSTAYQIYQIDSKLDDGIPNTGQIRENNTRNIFGSPSLGSANCETMTTPNAYNLNSATANIVSCSIVYLW